MDEHEPFHRPKRGVEIIVDSFWIAILAAIAFYIFGLIIGIVHPGELVGLSAAFAVLCLMWASHAWRAHRNEKYLQSDPRLHRDRERRGY